MEVGAERHTPFDNAACGCEGVTFSGNNVDVIGDIGSNQSVILGGADITGNIVAHDDLSGGTNSSVTGAGLV